MARSLKLGSLSDDQLDRLSLVQMANISAMVNTVADNVFNPRSDGSDIEVENFDLVSDSDLFKIVKSFLEPFLSSNSYSKSCGKALIIFVFAQVVTNE